MDELRVVGCYLLPPFVVAEEKGFFAREELRGHVRVRHHRARA